MASRKIKGDKTLAGDIKITNGLARSEVVQTALAPFPVPFTSLRVWDAMQTNLPGTAANDDLGLGGGTFATSGPRVTAGDLKSAGATTRYARFQVALPAEYDAGETITLRIKAGMLTTVAGTSCTIDAQVYKLDGATAIGSDLCTTSATTMNSLTFANKDFTITPTDLVAGDVLDVRLAIACTDADTGTVVEPAIGAVALLCDIRA